MCFEADLKSLELSERASAMRHTQKAKDSRRELKEVHSLWADGPAPESETQRIKQDIVGHKMRAFVAQSRADAAAEGQMLLTEAEYTDVEFMGRHQSLLDEAIRLGRTSPRATNRPEHCSPTLFREGRIRAVVAPVGASPAGGGPITPVVRVRHVPPTPGFVSTADPCSYRGSRRWNRKRLQYSRGPLLLPR